jgi:hypothetical protein
VALNRDLPQERGGPDTSAELIYPHAVALDKSGDLLIADAVKNQVREVTAFPFASLQNASLGFGNQKVGTVSAAQSVILKITGAVALSFHNITARVLCRGPFWLLGAFL